MGITDALTVERIDNAINSISSEYGLSRCLAASIIGRVILDANISKMPDSQTVEAIERHVLAKCLDNDQYMGPPNH